MAEDNVSVLIVDDSALMRNLIGRIVEDAEGLSVAGKAMNGKFALQKIPKLSPDIITLDLEMPEMNGIEFLKARKEQGIDIPVVVLSSLAKKEAKITMEALQLGAADFLLKPTGTEGSDIKKISRQLVSALHAYGLNYKKGRDIKPGTERGKPAEAGETAAAEAEVPPASAPVTPVTVPIERPAVPIEIVAIGISTGGPNALREVFASIDAKLPVPVVVVQHMPAGFTGEFAKSLDKISPLTIAEAKDGDILKPGKVFIAPGNFHIEVEKRKLAGVVTVNSNPPLNGHRPSADILFASVARHFGSSALAVIMTGMGKDGAREIGAVYKAGGITMAQDRQTCVVYGMPKVAVENGFINHICSLSEIGREIGRIVGESK